MITRPTTDTLLLDCCREVEAILPAIQDDNLRVRLAMTLTVLNNAAVRAAHEIAWMHEEVVAMLAFAEDVAAALPDGAGDAVRAAITGAATTPRSLHLADVVHCYEQAGLVFDAALRQAQEAGATDLVRRGADMLRARVDTEKTVMATYTLVGR